MSIDVRLVVVDAAPLITLAAAQSLDYLLYPALPVVIPDAVFHEATSLANKLGAQEIIDWYRTNTDRVRVEPTEIFQTEIRLRELPEHRPSRDVGERAALEVIRYAGLLESENDRAVLLSDDRDVGRLMTTDPERIILLTTWDYLTQLEEAQRIQSAEAVFDRVRQAGRNPPARSLWDQHDDATRDAVARILQGSGRVVPER